MLCRTSSTSSRNRANVWSKKIYFLSFRSLKEKAAGYLLGHSTGASPSVEMPDIREIAQYFDATRSAVQTVLAELRSVWSPFPATGSQY